MVFPEHFSSSHRTSARIRPFLTFNKMRKNCFSRASQPDPKRHSAGALGDRMRRAGGARVMTQGF